MWEDNICFLFDQLKPAAEHGMPGYLGGCATKHKHIRACLPHSSHSAAGLADLCCMTFSDFTKLEQFLVSIWLPTFDIIISYASLVANKPVLKYCKSNTFPTRIEKRDKALLESGAAITRKDREAWVLF